MKANGYSLWLLPPKKVREQLVRVIDKLSLAYDAPKFEPHITLLGSLQGTKENIIETSSSLCNALPSIQITLQDLLFSKLWKKCLFIQVELTEELMSSYQRAQEYLNEPRLEDYDPHISLIYGTYSIDVQKRMRDALEGWAGTTFWVDSAAIVATEGFPGQWKILRTFTLHTDHHEKES